ncbi:dipeptidase PepE [Streptomonospora nanhaiensis]|uniref:Dipeptidase E n=1 Tax=Streptomonospora nanhaiensis TaxID=1323731 RepID=A0A853BRJ5_9ACTN|nr:dipeptidase PepE [Streptomonospora nanhaiensis]MBV2366523.1 dipeptidase PepE [Streptomonospora nanhaiensis]MBX9391481.1 dipeptidase PepE [Streptomonospora nanhaiensis]NYI98369.1 dipeptidase E [Streptomonospora nanhaiensis]
MPELLLFSNSTNHGRGYLDHAWEEVEAFLDGRDRVAFVPFAGGDHGAYTARVAAAFAARGIAVTGVPADAGAAGVLDGAQAVFVGGGNTFRLVDTLQRTGLMDALRERVAAGLPYMGASAGTNITAPTLRTTNDMPIVEPASFAALGFLPFQINPHYLDADPASTHNGETRETRLREFLEANDVDVLGLREGTHLRVRGGGAEVERAVVGGTAVQPGAPGPAIVFRRGTEPFEVSGEVTDLFARTPRFDHPA